MSAYYLSEERVVLDPMAPAEGTAWFEGHHPPAQTVLTNRHHDPQAWRLHETFDCEVHCVRNGIHELEVQSPGRRPGLSFVPNQLMDDPEETQRGPASAHRSLLQLDFHRLLVAHGVPVLREAKAALRTLVADFP